MGADSGAGRKPDPDRLSIVRRRAVLITGAVVLVAASVIAVAAYRADPGRSGHRASAGHHAGGAGGTDVRRPAQQRLGPVLLVPGYGGDTSSLQPLAARLRAAGRTATVLQLPGAGTGSLIADAAVLNAAVSRDLKRGAPSVDVIGYSAGGVVALLWAQRDGGSAKARRVITLGAPFHGTQLAAAAAAFVPGECPAACRQLVPGSKLLASLTAADSAGTPRWLSLWTTDDAVVQPPDSAKLAGAVNVPVQSLCPAARISHSQLPTNPVVEAIVMRAIGAGPLRQPSAAACRASG